MTQRLAFPIVGFSGREGAGKDTAADAIEKLVFCHRLAFATPIKESLNAMFGWTMYQWADREWKERVIPELGKSPRDMARTLGTEWGRDSVHNDIWVRAVEARMRSYSQRATRPFLITDVRFQNEYDFIHSLGGIVVSIYREGTACPVTHSSEAGGLPLDMVIDNGGDIPVFHRRVQNNLLENVNFTSYLLL